MTVFFAVLLVNVTVVAVYLAGQGLHVALNAVNTVRSGLNSLTTYGGYFRNQGIFIAVRLFLTCAAALVAWDNPRLLALDKLTLTPLTQVGLAAMAGYSADSLFEKLAALVGLAPELPKA